MNRFWLMWYSKVQDAQAPFQVWEHNTALWAVIDAEDREQAEAAVRRHYPDAEALSSQLVDADWQPAPGMFPGFQNQTSAGEADHE